MKIAKNLLFKRHEEKITDIDPDALFIIENSFSVIGSSFGNEECIRREGKVLPYLNYSS
jgi:hypothetical protein